MVAVLFSFINLLTLQGAYITWAKLKRLLVCWVFFATLLFYWYVRSLIMPLAFVNPSVINFYGIFIIFFIVIYYFRSLTNSFVTERICICRVVYMRVRAYMRVVLHMPVCNYRLFVDVPLRKMCLISGMLPPCVSFMLLNNACGCFTYTSFSVCLSLIPLPLSFFLSFILLRLIFSFISVQ